MNEPWMPSDEEIDAAALSANPFEYEGTDELRALIRATVEKALAEREAAYLQDFLGWKEQEEARHKREVLEARIEALVATDRSEPLEYQRAGGNYYNEWWECFDCGAKSKAGAREVVHFDSCAWKKATALLAALRAELAALGPA